MLDPGETVVVKLTSATTDTRTVNVDATATKTTTIQEEDMVAVSVAAVQVEDNPDTQDVDESDDRSSVEEGETASFVVTLDGTVSGTVSVPYTTADVTAEAGADKDYTEASGTLEFTAGQISKTIEVTTLEDVLNEADETYTLTLTSVTGPAGVKLGTASATGTIEDDDPIIAALGATFTTSVEEGGEATYEVGLSGGTSTADVEVNYELDSTSTATSGTDYTEPSRKLTITAGESSGTITIATLTDQVLDPDETLVMKLTSASTDTRPVTVDDTATKITSISDTGEVSVSVAAVEVEDNPDTQDVDETDDRSSVAEGETASFVVTLDGTVSSTVSVPYTTADVTAEAGADKDYTEASGTLEFTAGQTSKTIEVTTLEDVLNEADETYTLTLTSVTGPAGVKLGTASATGTIEDDDPISAALGTTFTASVAEGGEATYEVGLSGGTSTANVEVNYAVDTSSSATSGDDYTAPSGTLTIAAGASNGTITIATLTDDVLDPGETVVVKLTSATTDTRTVNVDATATKTTTIQEEDMVAVSVAAVQVEDNPDTQDVDESDDRSSVEEGETASFVVTLDGTVSGTVSVPYTTADVTAEAGADKDYTEASGTLEFTAGQTSKTIEVTTLEDVLNEADETYTLTLTSVTGPAGVKLGTASATGTIEDDDPIIAALGATFTTSVEEGGEATYEVGLSGGTSTADVEVNYELDSTSTATSGTDYTAPSGTLTITAGAGSGTITIATLTDQVLDPDETLVVKLTSASTDTRPVTVDATATKTTTIGEEDMVAVSVAAVEVEDNPDTQDVNEGDDKPSVEEGETASFVVTLDGTVSGTVSVPYTTADVTAEAGNDKDYTEASGTLEFTAGQTSKTIEVTTLEDVLNEADETYTLTLTSVTGPAGVKLGTASATGTIKDDDALTAALGATFTTSVEEGGEATYEVGLSGGTSTADVEVNYELDSTSTATSGTDYTEPSRKLTITAGESSGTITIATLTDQVLDPDETLVMKLTSASTDTRPVTVDATATKTTTIGEEDMVAVSVAAVEVEDNPDTQDVNEGDDKSSVEEGETASFVVTLDGTVSGTVSVPYTTADVTAEAGADKDYTEASGTLEFTAGQTSKTIEVTTLEDVLNEADETYTLTLTSVTGPAGVKLGTASATGTIRDDDALTAALGATFTTSVEEGGEATYEVGLSGGTSTADVEVNYELDSTSTATSGTDYTAPSGTLTITAGAGSGTITIATLTDQVLDPDETLVVKLTSASTDTRPVTVDATATKTTTIGEEDMVAVSVAAVEVEDNPDTQDVNEGDDKSSVAEGETASFVVTLDGTVSGTVSVPYTTADVTAEAGADKDYTEASGTLEFTAGQTSKTIEVTTLEDVLNEADETYTLTLTSVTGPAGVKLGTASATGTIEDDDPLTAALGTHSEEPEEGDDATFAVDLSGGTSTADVEVSYAVDTSSTATSGTDYTAPSGKLTITAGESSGTITIATLTDQVLDPGETLVVKLTSATTDTRTVTVDATATKITSISDTGEASVSVAAVEVEDNPDTQDVDEGDDKSSVAEGETASFVVTLDRTVSGTVSVPYTTAGVTAEAGATKDYTEASGTLEFTAGQTSKTIDVTTLEDTLNEADETFTLTLTGVSGVSGVSLGTESAATGTIEDDDPLTAALGTHSDKPNEGDDATFAVDLSGGTSTANVEVNYAVDMSSTATAGDDYTAPSGKLTITAGESSGTITIATLTDLVLDPNETLVVKLSSATTDTRTVTVDTAATRTATITDTASVSVSLKSPATVVGQSEGRSDAQDGQTGTSAAEGETAQFIVELSGQVQDTVSVTYATENGTALSGNDKDYTEASGTLEFTSGQTSKTIDVTTLEDTLNEADETFTMKLTAVTGPEGVSLGTSTATGTIEDDDPLTAALDTTAKTVTEGADATFAVNLSGGTSTGAVVVDYDQDASSTATSGSDYTAPSGKLTITAGESSGTITIATLTDQVLDPGETLVMKLTGATTTGTANVNAATATATITDTGMAKVSVGDATATEGDSVAFEVELSFAVASAVEVSYATADDTAEEGEGKDYTEASGKLTFAVGDTSQTIEVTTLEDALDEADEEFTLTLTAANLPSGVSLDDDEATGTITDDDEVPGAPTGLSGAGGNTEVTLQWSAPGSAGTSAITGYEFRFKSGTDDYPATWTSAGGPTATTIPVTGLTNDILHSFQLRALSDAGDGEAAETTATPFWDNTTPRFTSTATPSVAENIKLGVTLQATDDDGDAIVGFAITGGADSDMFAIDDSSGLLFEIAPNFEDPKDVASTTPANDAANNEYVVVVTVTSGAGDRALTAEQTIVVTVTDAEEPPLAPGAPEVDTVSITSVRVRWLAPANTGPPITDYDYRYRVKTPQGEWLTVENTTITALEALITGLRENTEYQVQVRANNGEGTDGGAWSASGDGETEANASPHFTSSATFEIAENSTAAVGTVTAADTDSQDDVEAYAIVGGVDKLLFAIDATGTLSFKAAPNHEAPRDVLSTTPSNSAGNNEYVLVVMAVSGQNEREKSSKQTIVVTVGDEDEPPLTPDAPTVKPASPTSLTVTWSDKTDASRPAASKYDYQYREVEDPPGSWTTVTDYTTTSVTITGLTKETEYEVQVKAKSDEGESGWSDSKKATTPEAPVVTLVLDPDSIAEGGTSTVTATVAPALGAAFEIEVSAAADSGVDADVFTLSANVTLSFAANETASTGTVTIAAVDNALDDHEKAVTVSATVLDSAEVVAPGAQTLTITDDDVLAKVAALETTQCDPDGDPSACVEEGNDALFPVTLTGGTTTANVVIDYTVTSDDATVGVDYTAPSGKLTIASGETTGTIAVETNGDDDILDPGESLTVTLTSGTTTAGGVEVSSTPATMTIADTGQVTLSVADAQAAEGNAVNFAVKLSRKVASGVTFSYQTANGTAESGTGKDYTAASGELTFSATAKVMTVAVATLEDALDESDETFTFTLTASDLPAGVTLSDGVAIGTIQDDDTRGVTVSTTAVEVVKGGESKSYTLRLRSQPTGDVTIDINGPGGGVLVSPTQVTFTAQNWNSTKTVEVSATTDAAADTTETITHSVSGADYAGVTAGSVTVTIKEQTSVGLGVRPKNNAGTSGTASARGDPDVYVEGETIGFFVQRTSNSNEEVTVMITVTQEGDYLTGAIPAMVTLLPFEREKDIPVRTEDDAIVEPDGTVTITISSCNGCAVTTGTLTQAVLNNDARFAVEDAEAVESDGQITFKVTKRDSLRVPMTLQYETRNGSATAGQDYTAPDEDAVLTIRSEDGSATITIPVTDDSLVEGTESFKLRVFHPVDANVDMSATGTIKDDDAALAKAWLSRFGRTVASHVVEAVDARLSGELGPVTQVTLGGTQLPSVVAEPEPLAGQGRPHTTMKGDAFLAGSSFQLLATDAGIEGAAATGITMWGRGSATGLQGRDETVTLKNGSVGTGTIGVDYDFGSILTGLAVAYSGGGADYTLASDGKQTRSDETASWLVSAHPYARAQIIGDRLTAWGLLGYGLGQMTLAADAEDEETGISMMMGAMGLRGVLSPETNRFGLTAKTDIFVTRMTAGEGAAVETGAHRARLLAEGTYRMDFGTGGVLVPRLVTGVRYDFGDAETGFGAEMGGGVTYTYPQWGLTAAANLRVLLTHQDSGFEQWGGGGSLRVTPGAAGLGPSVAVGTSLGAPASGTQRLWTSGVAVGSGPSGAPGANLNAEMGYGLAVADGGGMLTPYVGMAVAEKGARAFRLGSRLSVGPAFSLSVQGERREETASDATHGVSVNGALRW